MVLGKKQKNYRKNKNYQNLKRRVYDCKNVVVSLVEAIEYKNKMKDDEKYKKIKEEQLMEIKKEFNYLRGMVGKNRLKYKENEELKVIKRLIKCECEMDEE